MSMSSMYHNHLKTGPQTPVHRIRETVNNGIDHFLIHLDNPEPGPSLPPGLFFFQAGRYGRRTNSLPIVKSKSARMGDFNGNLGAVSLDRFRQNTQSIYDLIITEV